MLKGGCFCGAIRYEARGVPSLETNCHCSICRRTSGAPFVAWFTVPTNQFHFVAGNPTRFKSSVHGTRGFCGQCGTPLTFQSARHADAIDVTTCSLDNPEAFPPKDHTNASAKLPWVQLSDDLPVYTGTRPD
jgi:hypothetical protein